ncbi:phosphosulfolactate synthase [Desulfocucumis palustris]|uniref:Phosphosulfolactate synthase n=1 Tax=Desulfocucumis palustris TaxID=1898651 RepID=A0A2L2XA04_9FIRM|nr:phosphosulfolactate synthase [Desulfocucumis palustris]GBF32978.1 phosphosulfolactate synthase [Desulfocucumis palustris]
MIYLKSNIWRDLITFPLGDRLARPRVQGLTMILDKGVGLGETRDLLNTSGEYVDLIKLGFGTTALYKDNILEEKIELVKSYGIDIYPGGTFLEVALLQNKLEEFLYLAKSLGFTCIEVSDGTISLSPEVRERAIVRAGDMGFKVLTEVGKKVGECNPPVPVMAEMIKTDLKNGAFRVILEGRESGINVGLYDQHGNFIKDDLDMLLAEIEDPRIIIWEAPQKDQQLELINRFGPNVNLGNIAPDEIMALEALRVGLRADTLKTAIDKNK